MQAVDLSADGVMQSVPYLPKYPPKAKHEYQDGSCTDVSSEKTQMKTSIGPRVEAARAKIEERRQKELRVKKQQRLQLLNKK